MSIAALRNRIDAVLDRLPQAKVIDAEDREAWTSAVMEMHAKNPLHVKRMLARLQGITPADASAIYGEHVGDPTGRSIHDIVSEKLLKLVPAPPSQDVERTERARPVIYGMFRQLLPNAETFPPHQGWDGAGTIKAPWMLGRPDEVLLIQPRKNSNPQLVIAEFRAPSQKVADEYRENGLPLELETRMHHHAIVGESVGLPIARRAVVVFDPGRWDIDVYLVERDKRVEQDLRSMAGNVWQNMVLKGVVPPAPEPRVVDPALLPEQFHAAALDFARFKAAAEHCKDQAELHRGTMLKELAKFGRLDGQQVLSGVVQVFAKNGGWDLDAMAQRLLAHGQNIEDFRRPAEIDPAAAASALVALSQRAADAVATGADATTRLAILDELAVALKGLPSKPGTLNPDAMADALRIQNEDLTRFKIEEPAVGFTRARKGPQAEQLAAFKEMAVDAVDRAVAVVHVPPSPTSPAVEPTAKRKATP